jgi:hypothetical protein
MNVAFFKSKALQQLPPLWQLPQLSSILSFLTPTLNIQKVTVKSLLLQNTMSADCGNKLAYILVPLPTKKPQTNGTWYYGFFFISISKRPKPRFIIVICCNYLFYVLREFEPKTSHMRGSQVTIVL